METFSKVSILLLKVSGFCFLTYQIFKCSIWVCSFFHLNQFSKLSKFSKQLVDTFWTGFCHHDFPFLTLVFFHFFIPILLLIFTSVFKLSTIFFCAPQILFWNNKIMQEKVNRRKTLFSLLIITLFLLSLSCVWVSSKCKFWTPP
jgi:hypothetical protein